MAYHSHLMYPLCIMNLHSAIVETEKYQFACQGCCLTRAVYPEMPKEIINFLSKHLLYFTSFAPKSSASRPVANLATALPATWSVLSVRVQKISIPTSWNIQTKNLPRGGYGYFLEQCIMVYHEDSHYREMPIYHNCTWFHLGFSA